MRPVCGILIMAFWCWWEFNFSISFSRVNANFCLSLPYNGDNSYLFVNGKEHNFGADNKNVSFSVEFCLGSMSNRSDAIWLQCCW